MKRFAAIFLSINTSIGHSMPVAQLLISKLIVSIKLNKALEILINLLLQWSLFWSDIICQSLTELLNPIPFSTVECRINVWNPHSSHLLPVFPWRFSVLFEPAPRAQQYAPISFLILLITT